MLTIRQLRYFEALAEALHFGRAARALNISQPALSAQIAAMEEVFGGPLFERRASGVLLTSDGILVNGRVRRILTDIRDLEGLGTSKGEVLAGRMRLGLIATVAPYLLPRLLPRLARDHARLDCEIRESVTQTLLRDVLHGELDCAVVAIPLERAELQTITLFEDRFHLAVPECEEHRFRGAVSVHALAMERLILLEEGHCLRDQALKICQLVEANELASLGATSLTTILRMVAGGLGATLIPDLAVEAESRGGGIRILPFQEPAPSRTLALAFRPSTARRRDFEALALLIRETARESTAQFMELTST
ncbi:MAG: hydrogen peroxide-inducible genes activator [Rhizobiaceae bacterium]|nr:hydrogen peroxide-inducible genes activator [Rhizobiaceae bacterium]